MLENDDGTLDLCTFQWFSDIYEMCNSDSYLLLNSAKDSVHIGYETRIGRDRKYLTKKFRDMLREDRIAYLDKLHQADILKQEKEYMDWVFSVRDKLCKGSAYLEISVTEMLKLLDRAICAVVKLGDEEAFIKLTHYHTRFSSSIRISTLKSKVRAFVSYYPDESWEVKTHGRLQPLITNFNPNGSIADKAGQIFSISVSFLVSPRMKRVLERIKSRYY